MTTTDALTTAEAQYAIEVLAQERREAMDSGDTRTALLVDSVIGKLGGQRIVEAAA